MTDLPPPLPPPPAMPIGYRDDADVSAPWVRFVRIVAAIGVVVASASLAQVLVTLMPALGLPSIMPMGIRFTLPRALMVVPSVLLLAGGIACLSLRPMGRQLMLAYAAAAVVVVILNVVFTAFDMLGRGRSVFPGGASGYVLYTVLSIATSAAFPTAVFALMRQPPVQRIFERR